MSSVSIRTRDDANHTLRATLPTMIERLRRDPKGWYQHNGAGATPPGSSLKGRPCPGAGLARSLARLDEMAHPW